MKQEHTLHIPVMGTAFSIDTPIKVAKYGISSVISLVDDTLIEHMRLVYCEKTGEDYIPITKYEEDFRARRITAYLDLVDRIVKQDFDELKASAFEADSEISKYFDLLPDDSPLKAQYKEMLISSDPAQKKELQEKLREQVVPGSIDVNIMTKLDRINFAAKDKTELGPEHSDALSGLRGYAKSTLKSSIVFSAGINQRLYSYLSEFKDFYADAKGFIKKKIVLKVSDFRSSFIQGKFFAKKGLWISEYRIESSLNCGGHAFATPGILLGPILDEFRTKRQELVESLHTVFNQALKLKNRVTFLNPLGVRITAQGGIGTTNENNFLIRYFKLDGTGWATPFLLVPEVTNVDKETLSQLSAAKEKDLYLSYVSPLNIPFNNLRNSQSDSERDRKIDTGKPGSACPRGHLVSNTEFTEKPICTASRQYQKLKIEQLEEFKLKPDQYSMIYENIVSKACICNDLAEPAFKKYKTPMSNGKRFSSVCPGPNLAYFSKITTLAEMVGHVYGRNNLIERDDRPNIFIKEIGIYLDYLAKEVLKTAPELTEKQIKYFNVFKENLIAGINYCRELLPQMVDETTSYRLKALEQLEQLNKRFEAFLSENVQIFGPANLSPVTA